MKRPRLGESGSVNVYINEQIDVAILTMPVREAVMLMALAGQVGGPEDWRPSDTWGAMGEAFGWEKVTPAQAAKWHAELYARFGFKTPRENKHGVNVFESVESIESSEGES